ncbi:hypothetical protein RJ640_002482 [Escallonia rubra]|uniref:Protein kinase domain-containing protein n=1 Tax=Escallonia rubra TaxID=112253 RepID=A0AA88S155_9ASTE|nr:hypothetical protein RJ640_002482 [Escallonia rubra]
MNGNGLFRFQQRSLSPEIVEVQEESNNVECEKLMTLEVGSVLWLEDSNWKNGYQIHEVLSDGEIPFYIASSIEDGGKRLLLYVGSHHSQLEPAWEHMKLWYQVQRQTKILTVMKQKGLSSKFLPQLSASGRIIHPGQCRRPSPGGNCDHPWCGTPILVTSPVGETVANMVRLGQFGLDEAIRCCHDCLSALSAAAAAGIRHGDIRPENVICVKSSVRQPYFVLIGWGHAILEERDRPAMNLHFSSTYALQEGKLCAASDAESLVYLLYFCSGGDTPDLDSVEGALQWREMSWSKRLIQQKLGDISAVLKAFADYVDSLCATPYPIDYNIWLRRLKRNVHEDDRGKEIDTSTFRSINLKAEAQQRSLSPEIVEVQEESNNVECEKLMTLEVGSVLWLEDSNWKNGYQIHEVLSDGEIPFYIASSIEDGGKRLFLYVGSHHSQLEPAWEHMKLWYQVQRQTKILTVMKQKGLSSKFLPQLSASGRIIHPGQCRRPSPGGNCDHPWCGTPILVTSPVGETVANMVRLGQFGLDEAIRCCHDCLSALSAAAAAGIRHGDIRPENVICVKSSGDTPDLDSVEGALQWREMSWSKRLIQQKLGDISAVLKAFADYVDSLCATPYPIDYNIWLRRLKRNVHEDDRGKEIDTSKIYSMRSNQHTTKRTGKLEQVISELAHEVAEKHAAIEGDLVVTPSDEHFWLNQPLLVLILIHIILFQNSFELAFFFFIWQHIGNYFHLRAQILGMTITVLITIATIATLTAIPIVVVSNNMAILLVLMIMQQIAVAVTPINKHLEHQHLASHDDDLSNKRSNFSGEATVLGEKAIAEHEEGEEIAAGAESTGLRLLGLLLHSHSVAGISMVFAEGSSSKTWLESLTWPDLEYTSIKEHETAMSDSKPDFIAQQYSNVQVAKLAKMETVSALRVVDRLTSSNPRPSSTIKPNNSTTSSTIPHCNREVISEL